MKVAYEKVGDVLTVKVSGRVVGSDTLQFRRDVSGWIAEIPEAKKPKVVLVLDSVSMMDSAGMGALVSCFTFAQKREGRLVLAGLGRGVKNLIVQTKLSRVFEIYETEEEAIKSFET